MSIAALIVTHNPSLERLRQVLRSIEPACELVMIVDNGSDATVTEEISAMLDNGEKLIALEENEGIAAAQNVGLILARESQIDRVLLLDQDSVPAIDMVDRLAYHLSSLIAAGIKVAAVGPRLTDGRWKSRQRLRPRGRSSIDINLLEVDHLIASGALVPMSTIDAIGSMREELFIDFVDIEWGLRALSAGYRSYVAIDAEMDHQLGAPMKVLGRTISTHSPMRHYYMVRNAIWLLRQSWLQPKWRYVKMPKIALHLLINAIFAEPHKAHRGMMARGVRDGIKGRMGKGHE